MGVGATAAEAGGSQAPLLGPVPLVAIPIIAGIGSEVTPMATILDDNDPLEPEKVYTSVRVCTSILADVHLCVSPRSAQAFA